LKSLTFIEAKLMGIFMKTRCLLLLAGIFLFLFSGCGKDKPLPDGYKKIIGNNDGAVVDTILVQTEGIEKFYSKLISTAPSTELMLGNYGPYRSGMFLTFNNLPDTVIVKSARLLLSIANNIAPVDSSFWNISHAAELNIFLADTSWDVNNPPVPDMSLLLGKTFLYSDSTNKIQLALDSLTVDQWADSGSGIRHYGIWLETVDAPFMQIYSSINLANTELAPKLQLIYTTSDSIGAKPDTTEYYATQDASFLLNNEMELNLNPDLFYIGKGLAFRSWLNFDLGGLDTNAHINRAILELTANRSNSIRDFAGINECIIYRLTEEWQDGNVSENQTGASYSPTVMDSVLTFEITPSFQAWLGDKYPNYGFLAKSLNEQKTIGRIAFYSSKHTFELQPKIYLYYTLPPKQEF